MPPSSGIDEVGGGTTPHGMGLETRGWEEAAIQEYWLAYMGAFKEQFSIKYIENEASVLGLESQPQSQRLACAEKWNTVCGSF